VTVERLDEASAYNAYVGAIGTWSAPDPALGACALAGSDNGDGTVTLAFALPVNAWIDVTASTTCAEGPAGTDSEGRRRTDAGTWSRCGPAP
jgi:hypothetical protein